MSSQDRLFETIRRELGPSILALLDDSTVTNIFRNPDGHVWFTSTTLGTQQLPSALDHAAAVSLVNTVATLHDRYVSEALCTLETTLPASFGNIRFTAVTAPISPSPIIALRKPPRTIFPLAHFIAQGMLSPHQAEFLTNAVRDRANIAIAGAVDTGKTTFANALLLVLSQVAPLNARVVILEDIDELQFTSPNAVKMFASAPYPLQELVRLTLRLNPRNIVIGELRGAEAHAAVKAWGTGIPGGLCTLHANDPLHVFTRLDHLIREDVPHALPGAFIPLLVETLGVVVHITVDDTFTRRAQVHQVKGLTPDGKPILSEIQ